MEEHVREMRDGGRTWGAFEGLPLVGVDPARRGLPTTRAREITATGSPCGTPGTRVGGRQRMPVGGRRATPGFTLPDHDQSHAARSPQMGGSGHTGLAGRHVTIEPSSGPLASIDLQRRSPVAKYPPPALEPAIRCAGQSMQASGLRDHSRPAPTPPSGDGAFFSVNHGDADRRTIARTRRHRPCP